MQMLVPGKRRHALVADKRAISAATNRALAEVVKTFGTIRLYVLGCISAVHLNKGPKPAGAEEMVDVDAYAEAMLDEPRHREPQCRNSPASSTRLRVCLCSGKRKAKCMAVW